MFGVENSVGREVNEAILRKLSAVAVLAVGAKVRRFELSVRGAEARIPSASNLVKGSREIFSTSRLAPLPLVFDFHAKRPLQDGPRITNLGQGGITHF